MSKIWGALFAKPQAQIEDYSGKIALEQKTIQGYRRRNVILSVCFACLIIYIALQIVLLAISPVEEPETATYQPKIFASRSIITDRKDRVLATNIDTFSVYAHPQVISNKGDVAEKLAEVFPDLDEQKLTRQFSSNLKFLWIKRNISPEEKQAVYDIGDPGLIFGPREMRLYPNGAVGAHILGGTRYGEEGAHSAEIIGVGGVEHRFDTFLRDPKNQGQPLKLSIDMTIQAALEQALEGGMNVMNAKGASAVLLDVHTGEIISIASLPDFDPNHRPRPLTTGAPDDSPLFNRSVQGVYELGSVLKPFAIAQALELGIVTPSTKVDIRGPLRIGSFKVRDFKKYGNELTASKVLIKSSNIGTARLADKIGPARQQAFLERLGLLALSPIEVTETKRGKPKFAPHPSDKSKWSRASGMTISYGHGITTSPVLLAAAYASLVNGGTLIKPTLLAQEGAQQGQRVLSSETSEQMRIMMRRVVTEGSASLAEVAGYFVGGKTGTAEKPKPSGGYYEDRNLTTFGGFFPADAPKYVLVVSLDEPEVMAAGEMRATAGWTAVPTAAEIIRRIAPLMQMAPRQEIDPAFTPDS